MKNRSYKPILRVYKMGKLARKPLLFIIGHTSQRKPPSTFVERCQGHVAFLQFFYTFFYSIQVTFSSMSFFIFHSLKVFLYKRGTSYRDLHWVDHHYLHQVDPCFLGHLVIHLHRRVPKSLMVEIVTEFKFEIGNLLPSLRKK